MGSGQWSVESIGRRNRQSEIGNRKSDSMLHILNGECTETILAQTAISGERFSFRDVLIGGPTPAGLDEAEWRKVRAAHLSASYDVDVVECERDLRAPGGSSCVFR